VLVFILVLLLVAAILGILGWVIKVAAVIVLSTILALVIFVWLIWWMVKRETRKYLDAGEQQRQRRVYDAEGHVRRNELPD
jgi:ABC-type transport system involved in cytochrome bd biosynthesis fused ATPase/permease subunit